MVYVVSDIHGRFDKWKALLKAIKPSWSDTVYVLGDTVDRGPEGLRTLLDMASRPNVVHLLGNHEYMFMSVLPTLLSPVTDEFAEELERDDEAVSLLANYLMNGGEPTIAELQGLSAHEREGLREYMLDMSVYEEIDVAGKTFLLVHAGLDNFNPEKSLEDYGLHDFLWKRPTEGERYYPDKTVVFGHTPTQAIRRERQEKGEGILIEEGKIAIDCGCGHGGSLGCLCLDTMECVYV